MNNQHTFPLRSMPWSPRDRDLWIQLATESPAPTGYAQPYAFHTMPQLHTPQENLHASRLTQILNQSIFSRPQLRPLSLDIYHAILHHLHHHDDPLMIYYTHFAYIRVVLKGGNALALMFPPLQSSVFPFSDLDIGVFIHPDIPDFDHVHRQVNLVLFRVFSIHKKKLDHALFLSQPDVSTKNQLLSDQDIQLFKTTYADALRQHFPHNAFPSVMDDDATRNIASRNAFCILPKHVLPDHVVRVDIPHLPDSQHIPLRKTPITYSYNNTVPHFDLHRLKLQQPMSDPTSSRPAVTVQMENTCDDEELRVVLTPTPPPFQRVSADLVDVCVPKACDPRNRTFWKNEYRVVPFTPSDQTHPILLQTPSLRFHVHDLQYMLHHFPHQKSGARTSKLLTLRTLQPKSLTPCP